MASVSRPAPVHLWDGLGAGAETLTCRSQCATRGHVFGTPRPKKDMKDFALFLTLIYINNIYVLQVCVYVSLGSAI